MSKIICFYHSADFDGMCSAAIVKHTHNMNSENVECIGINYGEEFPWDEIGSGDLVYMVDFGLQPFKDMVLLNGITNLIWIDHHKTALDDYDKAQIPFKGLRSLELSGCQLTWDYFFKKPHQDTYTRPPVIDLLGWYDIWQHDKMDNIVEFQYGLKSFKVPPEHELWPMFFISSLDDKAIKGVIEKGKTILSYKEQCDIKKMKNGAFVTEIGGYTALAINALGSSEMFDSIWDNTKYDLMLTFGWSRDGHWNCGMYTDKEGVNVGTLAKKLGGGGHNQAAGFQCDQLPFNTIKNP